MIYNNFEKRIEVLDSIITENLKSIDAVSVVTESYGIVLENEKFDAFKQKVKDTIKKIIDKIKEILKWIADKIKGFFVKIKGKFKKNLKEELKKAEKVAESEAYFAKKLKEYEEKEKNASSNESALLTESVTREELNEWLKSQTTINEANIAFLDNVERLRNIILADNPDEICKILYLQEEIATVDDFVDKTYNYIVNGKYKATGIAYIAVSFEKFIEISQKISDIKFDIYIEEFEKALKKHQGNLEEMEKRLNTVSNVNSLQDLLKIGSENTPNILKYYSVQVSGTFNLIQHFIACVREFETSYAKAEAFLGRVNGQSSSAE